jgi:23S rRNA (uracil1939-C5)-methyltransferase
VIVELAITALAAGGDGVARDGHGRVTFVPGTAVGDRVRARIVHETASFARAELVEVVAPSPDRVVPVCEYVARGCGGCQWQHVARPAQLAAKQAIVANALRRLDGLAIEPIADPAPPLGWRRRARFHVAGGAIGLYRAGSRELVPLGHCPQLEPGLDAALAAVIAAHPPDGELAVVIGHRGEVVVGTAAPWPGAARLVDAGIAGVTAGAQRFGPAALELEPELRAGPWDFAQASAAGNAALVAIARAALGPAAGAGPGGPIARGVRGGARLLELHAGAGNFTRAFIADGWDVVASDLVRPAAPPASFEHGPADRVLARVAGPFDAIVLDPPRAGARDAIPGILRHAPGVVVYISCDPATLARDAAALVGYRAERAWPIDLMPQTAHVEVVLRLVRSG